MPKDNKKDPIETVETPEHRYRSAEKKEFNVVAAIRQGGMWALGKTIKLTGFLLGKGFQGGKYVSTKTLPATLPHVLKAIDNVCREENEKGKRQVRRPVRLVFTAAATVGAYMFMGGLIPAAGVAIAGLAWTKWNATAAVGAFLAAGVAWHAPRAAFYEATKHQATIYVSSQNVDDVIAKDASYMIRARELPNFPDINTVDTAEQRSALAEAAAMIRTNPREMEEIQLERSLLFPTILDPADNEWATLSADQVCQVELFDFRQRWFKGWLGDLADPITKRRNIGEVYDCVPRSSLLRMN
tara:strand:- start:74 stop:970 length:897 start_codon:yes stop_codon:yes gene_type:complete